MKQQDYMPGPALKSLSFFPALNLFAVFIAGVKSTRYGQALLTVLYCAALSALNRTPNAVTLLALWLLPMGHFWCLYAWQKRKASRRPERPDAASASGKTAEAQISPTPVAVSLKPDARVGDGSPAHERFLHDMRCCADLTMDRAEFVPFMAYPPTYESMTPAQRAWYFYWRNQVRQWQYPDTDLSYIRVYLSELVSGIGWEKPAEGQRRLLALWGAYRARYPRLDGQLWNWGFDFARVHHLTYEAPERCPLCEDCPGVRADLMIDALSASVPLKLPFSLIDALCDYEMTRSKFYLDGHGLLMEEAIPRAVALADAALRKKSGKGILATYGPKAPQKQKYTEFPGLLCPDANRQREVSVKPYTHSEPLRAYVNELVRYGENELREINHYRGRLRGITLEEETAALVKRFLQRAYGRKKAIADPLIERITARNIRYVDRRARGGCLWIAGGQELSEFVREMAEEGITFKLVEGGGRAISGDAWWTRDALPPQPAPEREMKRVSLDFADIETLRRQSDQVREALRVDTEEPDPPALTECGEELAQGLSSAQEPAPCPASGDAAEERFQQFVDSLAPQQRQTLRILLGSPQAMPELTALAEKTMSLPQMLLDDLNEAALNSLGEIILDISGEEPCILEEYLQPLQNTEVTEG